MTIAHVTMAARDVQAVARFYASTMRWEPIPLPANTPVEAAWLEIGPGQQLHVIEVADYEPSRFDREFGRHLAVFHPGSDFDELKQRLVEHGAELIDPVRPTPFERFFFKDPNGYAIEVIDSEQYAVED